jgi:hypothetical protein
MAVTRKQDDVGHTVQRLENSVLLLRKAGP